MKIEINLKLENGTKINLTFDEAKELFNLLNEIFGNEKVVLPYPYPVPSYPYPVPYYYYSSPVTYHYCTGIEN